MSRICYVLDLKDDALLIAEYDRYHLPGNVWPEIIADIKAQGYLDMEIWRSGNRLVMIAEVEDDFPHADRAHKIPKIVAQWEELMSSFQEPVSHAGPNEKWVSMIRMFSLQDHSPKD